MVPEANHWWRGEFPCSPSGGRWWRKRSMSPQCLAALVMGFFLGVTVAMLHSVALYMPQQTMTSELHNNFSGSWYDEPWEDNVIGPPPAFVKQELEEKSNKNHYKTSNRTPATSELPPQTPDYQVQTQRNKKKCFGSVAARLFQQVRILCLVVTFPDHHNSHALHIYRTWGRRCSKIIFVTNKLPPEDYDEDPANMKEEAELPYLPVPHADEGRDGLWNKTRDSFRHAYKQYRNDFDWFVKADDDTYIIMENLRYWLHDKDPDEAQYYGCHFSSKMKQGYNSGGAGYILSRGALEAFVKAVERNKTLAHSIGDEDVQMGMFMEIAGVKPGDSRDERGRPRFFPVAPGDVVVPKEKDLFYWYWDTINHDHDLGLSCCSETTISFHYVRQGLLYTLEFFIYHLKAYGLGVTNEEC